MQNSSEKHVSTGGSNTVLPAVWTDAKGRQVVISSMSDYWLNNVRKMFKGEDRQKIQPIMDEIKRRKKMRSLSNGR